MNAHPPGRAAVALLAAFATTSAFAQTPFRVALEQAYIDPITGQDFSEELVRTLQQNGIVPVSHINR
jgi:hypothetical protein